MNNRILYFSRSGSCRGIAQKIAKKLDCNSSEITDNVSWKGFFGFMKGGFYSLSKKETEVSVEDNYNVADADNIILVVPLWAGGTAPAGYSFLKKEISNIKNLYMIICSDGTEATKAYSRLEEMVGPLKNKFGIINSNDNEDEIINRVCNEVAEG